MSDALEAEPHEQHVIVTRTLLHIRAPFCTICRPRVMPEIPHGDSNGTDAESNADNPPPQLPLPDLCGHLHQRIETFLRTEPRDRRMRTAQDQTRKSLQVIEDALRRYRLDELSISYNGGKDCLVLLILYLSALHSHFSPEKNNSIPTTLNSVYIVVKNPFKSVDDFVASSVQRYHLYLSRYDGPMKDSFADYLKEHPKVRAIFVGTRRTDPHGSDLSFFDPTTRGWPDFMRIHPVIDWHYAEIWTFIRELAIPYCSLYDLGYTSLGGTTDTHPNPALAFQQDAGAGMGGFRPAYELIKDDDERLGRS